MSDYHKTMGQIAQVARKLVGGEDINGFYFHPACVEDAGHLIEQLRPLLDKYDRQMIEAARDELAQTLPHLQTPASLPLPMPSADVPIAALRGQRRSRVSAASGVSNER